MIKESELPNIAVIKAANIKFLNFGFAGDSLTSAINGRNFILPSTPYQIYPGHYEQDRDNNEQTCQKKCPLNKMSVGTVKCAPFIHSIQIATNKQYDEQRELENVVMVLSSIGCVISLDDFSHPVHLHGHSFHVVHVEHGSYENGILHDNTKTLANCSALGPMGLLQILAAT